MSAAGTGWVLALTGWVLLVGGIATENMAALWIAMGMGTVSLVLLWWLSGRAATADIVSPVSGPDYRLLAAALTVGMSLQAQQVIRREFAAIVAAREGCQGGVRR